MTERATPAPNISRLAQSLATLIYDSTLSSPELSAGTAAMLRTLSRKLCSLVSSDSPEKGPTESTLRQIVAMLSSSEIAVALTGASLAGMVGLCKDIGESLKDLERKPTRAHSATGGLRGAVVLITRPFAQARASAEAVERAGGVPVLFPIIEIVDPDDWQDVDHAIVNLKGYDGVIFTSTNAVERFVGRILDLNSAALRVLATRRIYAVGSKTRASLENAQIPVTLMPERFSAADLLEALGAEPLAGKSFLFPKGNLAKEEIPEALRARDAVVDEVVVYKTAGKEISAPDPLRQAFANGEIDCVAFFSPSAVHSFAGVVDPSMVARKTAACIGSTTAEAAAKAGFGKIVTADEATSESLVETLARHFKREQPFISRPE